ncbi:MAG: amidohydrolase family protein, partial [Anaerolineae bacterium]|nr:amidohydrolase family protein [Anaerolineae bacterium]
MSDLLITHGQVFTLGRQNELISDGAIYVEGDTIAEVGATAALAAKYPTAERLDAAGKLILPGSICGHTHFYGAFARGMAIPGAPATNFVEILERLWWKLDRALLWDDIRASALICLVDAIRHGCTTLIDHHASPNVIDGSLDIIADAVKETGLRASLCYEVTDRNGMAGAAAGISENVRFIKRCLSQPDPQLAASFGLHAALTLSDQTLEASARAVEGLAARTGFHIHVAEDKADEDQSLRKYNLRVVERLRNFGILGPRSIAVHCVHLDEYEKDMLKESGTWVT